MTFRKMVRMKALVKSTNIPPTMGTTRKALGEGPNFSVMACMLAMALE